MHNLAFLIGWLPVAAMGATYTFAGSSFPACSSGSWSTSGNTHTCDGSISLASGDRILPAASITVVAKAGVTLAGANTLGSAGAPVNLQGEWGNVNANNLLGASVIYGNVTTSSGAINFNKTTVHGAVASGGGAPITLTNSVVDGNITSSSNVTATGSTINGSIVTSGSAFLSGGSVSGSVTASNGVSTLGTTIGGNVQASSGSISLTGGSVGGAVHSDCCTVSTWDTDVGDGISSSSNTVTVFGGSITGTVSSSGGSGVIVILATVTGNIAANNVAINIVGSTIYGNVSGNNSVWLTVGTTVWGDVTAASWWGALYIDFLSQVAGNCTPYNGRCNLRAIDHIRLTHTGSGVTCVGSNVTVTACYTPDDASGNCVTSTRGVTGTIVARNGGADVVSVAFSKPSGQVSASVAVPVTVPQTVTFAATGVSPSTASPYSCWNTTTSTASCDHEYKASGFIFSSAAGGDAADIPTQRAGVESAALYLRAVKTSPKDGSCDAAIEGTRTVNLAYQCIDPVACAPSDLMTVTAGTGTSIRRNDSGGVSQWTPVSLTFAGGTASFTLNYADVGKIALYARGPAGLYGVSNSFVTKPYAFKVVATCAGTPAVVNSASQTSPSAADAKFCPAGAPFNVVASAMAQGDKATPNYGRETTKETVAVSWSRHLPDPGADGILSPRSDKIVYTYTGAYTGHDSDFTGSFAATTDINWSEVGILKATTTVGDGDYMGTGNVSSNTYVGRFYPHHFLVSAKGASQCNGFAYSGRPGGAVAGGIAAPGQPFNLVVTAKSAIADPTVATTTLNYTSSFAKEVTLSDVTPPPAPGAKYGSVYRDAVPGIGTIAADKFSLGIGNIKEKDATGKISYVFDTYPTKATDIILHAQDDDNKDVSVVGDDGALNIRSGRLRMSNATGSDKRPLKLPLQAQYWSGLTWVLNDADSCTTVPANSVFRSRTLATVSGASALTNGKGNVSLTAPSRAGSMDLAINLGGGANERSCLGLNGSASPAALSWLRASGACAATHDRDPSARATFGIYTSENRRTVFIREGY